MAQYVDKSALIAEIDRRIKEIEEIGTYLSPKGTLTNLLCYINTLEVKEINEENHEDFVDGYWENKYKEIFKELKKKL